MSYRVEFADKHFEFRPCPFCGGEPEWIIIPGEDIVLRCSDCHASTRKYFWTRKDAVRAWNKADILQDNFTITMDVKIDDFFKNGVEKVLLGECSEFENGYICDEAVIIASDKILSLEQSYGIFHYEELLDYGKEYYSKSLAEEDKDIELIKSTWKNKDLTSLEFRVGNKKITMQAGEKEQIVVIIHKEVI